MGFDFLIEKDIVTLLLLSLLYWLPFIALRLLSFLADTTDDLPSSFLLRKLLPFLPPFLLLRKIKLFPDILPNDLIDLHRTVHILPLFPLLYLLP